MEDNILIRKAVKEDATKIIDLFTQLTFESTEDKLLDFFENNEIPKSFLYLAEQNKTILGAIDFSIVNYFYYQEPVLCIRAIVIDETKRGQGIGHKLMEFAEDQARNNNCYYLELVSGIKRHDAHRFYLNLGFSNDTHYYFRKFL